MRVTGTERNANYLILGAFALFAIWPIVGIVVAGLQPEGDAPGGLANLEQAWQIGRFGGYLRTSVMVSAFVVSVSAVLSVLAGFALGTVRDQAGILAVSHSSTESYCHETAKRRRPPVVES